LSSGVISQYVLINGANSHDVLAMVQIANFLSSDANSQNVFSSCANSYLEQWCKSSVCREHWCK